MIVFFKLTQHSNVKLHNRMLLNVFQEVIIPRLF